MEVNNSSSLEKKEDVFPQHCPECSRLGIVSHLALFQISFNEAFLMCCSKHVSYIKFCIWYLFDFLSHFVQRNENFHRQMSTYAVLELFDLNVSSLFVKLAGLEKTQPTLVIWISLFSFSFIVFLAFLI